MLLAQHGGDPVADLDRGVIGRHTVEIAARRGGGGRGVGHLVGAGRGDPHRIQPDAKDIGGHLRHLDVEPLAHFGAAMVEADRAIGIDQHQRARLIEMGGGEADAEFDGGERNALLQHRMRLVEGCHGIGAGAVMAAGFQLGDDLGRDEILDRHAIGVMRRPLSCPGMS